MLLDIGLEVGRYWFYIKVRRMDRSMVARLTTFLLNKGLSDEEVIFGWNSTKSISLVILEL